MTSETDGPDADSFEHSRMKMINELENQLLMKSDVKRLAVRRLSSQSFESHVRLCSSTYGARKLQTFQSRRKSNVLSFLPSGPMSVPPL